MGDVASIRELHTAIGFKKQAALQTPLVAADCWSLKQTSEEIPQPEFIFEDDAQDLGKGDGWATEQFKSHINVAFPFDYFLTSEHAAQMFGFALGKVATVAAGDGFKHTYTPLVPVTDGRNLPATTFVSAIRQGGSDVVDIAMIGGCCEEVSLSMTKGPGRGNAQIKSRWVGCGAYAKPSTITIPAQTALHPLNAGGASTVSLIGQNHLTSKRFESLEFTYKNNIDLEDGFYLGSGAQNGFQIRGRLRQGDPTIAMSFVVEFVDGSTELDDFLAQTEGTVVIVIPGAVIGAGPTTHKLELTLHRATIKSSQIGKSGNKVTIKCDCTAMKHASNGIITVAVTCLQEDMLVEAA